MIAKEFLDGKKKALKKLEKALEENKVDEEILPIIDRINISNEYYTSSSCAGRILLLEIPRIGDKKNARFLGKWHSKVNLEEITTSAKDARNGTIWLLAQSPIIHVVADSYESADRMVKTANASGFKNSSIKSPVGKKILVEICSTERLDTPIGRNGSLLCDERHLQLLVEISNEVIEKSKDKLMRFQQKLKDL
jgi:tRNA wybutosine-synthesizing protein 3